MATGLRRTGRNPLAYMGVDALTPPQLFLQSRAPETSDHGGFNVGAFWLVNDPKALYMLAAKSAGVATWVQLYPGAGGGASTFTTDVCDANEVGGFLKILGDPNIVTSGAGNEVTIELTDSVTISGNFTSTAGNVIVDGNVTAGGEVNWNGDGSFPPGNTLTGGLFNTNSSYLFTNGHAEEGILSTQRDFGSDKVIGLGYGDAGQILVGVDLTDAGPTWRTIGSAAGTVNITYPTADTINFESNALPIGGTNGQLLVGADAPGSAAWADLTSSDATIDIVTGPNTLDVTVVPGIKGKVFMGKGVGITPVYGVLKSSDLSINVDTSVAEEIDLTVIGGGAGTEISFMAYQATSSASIAFAYHTVVNLGEEVALTEAYNNGGGLYVGDGAGAKALFTAPVKGRYHFNMTIGRYNANSTNYYPTVFINTDNGNFTNGSPQFSTTTNNYNTSLSADVELDVGETAWFGTESYSAFNGKILGDQAAEPAGHRTYISGYLINKVTAGIGGNAYSFNATIPRGVYGSITKWATYINVPVKTTFGYLGDKGSAPLEVQWDTDACFYSGDLAGNGCSYTAPVDGIYVFYNSIGYFDRCISYVVNPNDTHLINFNERTLMQLNAGDVVKWGFYSTGYVGMTTINIMASPGIDPVTLLKNPAYEVSGYLVEAI